MFKNTILYRIVSGLTIDAPTIESALKEAEFVQCGASQEKSVGWVPPRGQEHGALLEVVGGQWILKLMTETKKVPGDVLKRAVEAQIKAVEAATGRKPGKKETRDLKEDAKLALLPMAFSAQAATLVWIDLSAGLMVVDASSQSKADNAITALIKSVDGLALQLINTQTSPAAAMAHWLSTKEAPAGFSVDRECELKACDESKAVVKYGRHALDIDEVAQHIAMGKVPTKLAMTWDSRVSFVLTEGLQLKKITFLDTVFESAPSNPADKADDNFDADAAIATGELVKLIPDLLEAMGGEVASEAAQAGGTEHSASVGSAGEPDPIYDQAVDIVRTKNMASISLVQRHLAIGYNRAARLIEDMERAGIVSPMGSSGSRTVIGGVTA
jgi:recombination associated protein RdgC